MRNHTKKIMSKITFLIPILKHCAFSKEFSLQNCGTKGGQTYAERQINRNFLLISLPVLSGRREVEISLKKCNEERECNYQIYQDEYLSFMKNLMFPAYICTGNMIARTVPFHNIYSY